MNVEITPRRRGKKNIDKYQARGPHTAWRRVSDLLRDSDWAANFARVSINPNCGTKVGMLYNDGKFEPRHCEGARIYAEVVGRHDRDHKDAKLPRTPGSPSYEMGFRGADDEVERRTVNGTIKAYEKRAKRSKKAFDKLMGCIPNETAHRVLDDLCIHDIAPPSHLIEDIRAVLDVVIKKFQYKFEQTHDSGKIKAWSAPPAPTVAQPEPTTGDAVGAGDTSE